MLIVVLPRREQKTHLVVEQRPAAELREGGDQRLREIGWVARLEEGGARNHQPAWSAVG
jgi:hypothetical protein